MKPDIRNRSKSFLADRVYGLGLGIFVSALFLKDASETRLTVWLTVGVSLLILSVVLDFIHRRRQIIEQRTAADKQLNEALPKPKKTAIKKK